MIENARATSPEEVDCRPAASNTSPVHGRPSDVPIPRVMFSTPEATPAWRGGTAPMIVALFGGVNAPMPIPTTARSTRKSEVAGRSSGQGHEAHR